MSDDQKSRGVAIMMSHSFGVLDHQRRDLHLNRLTFRKIRSITTGHSSFAECNTRQRTLDELYIGNSLFAEYFLSGTRQRKVTVTAPSDGDGSFAECLLWHSAKRLILPSVCSSGPRQRRVQWAPPPVPVSRALVGTRQRVLQWAPLPVTLPSALATTLGKDGFTGSQVSFFAECHGQHSAKMALPVPRFPSLPSAKVIALGKATLCRVLHSAK
jgi:hypothetical protein